MYCSGCIQTLFRKGLKLYSPIIWHQKWPVTEIVSHLRIARAEIFTKSTSLFNTFPAMRRRAYFWCQISWLYFFSNFKILYLLVIKFENHLYCLNSRLCSEEMDQSQTISLLGNDEHSAKTQHKLKMPWQTYLSLNIIIRIKFIWERSQKEYDNQSRQKTLFWNVKSLLPGQL